MSVFQGWCCFKSVKVSFPQYLPICSEIGSQLETIGNKKVFKKLFIFYGFQCQCLNILANTERMVPQLIFNHTTPEKLAS